MGVKFCIMFLCICEYPLGWAILSMRAMLCCLTYCGPHVVAMTLTYSG
ncbi:hypothetical protein ISN45_At01g024080 [Arabidopsis thaliana x Arabidopsis arenosa]|uniref:Uncharacterized protein n=1 Tax=Arabidopsis thaliana x Arabidopsis arenosa TaxID=1240361 RepID=A0A8T2GJ67_9BRAS|nr:hypothetical protein ISN45_At01g024080 [Arabidopsis thaliana x Arabidopsis arenosa]